MPRSAAAWLCVSSFALQACTAQRLGASAFLRGTRQAFLGALPDPVTLEGDDGSQHSQLQLAGGVGQAHAVEVEATNMNLAHSSSSMEANTA